MERDTVNLYNARPDYIVKLKPFHIFMEINGLQKSKKLVQRKKVHPAKGNFLIQ